ncbi:MAG: LOG family protein, partial [Bacteroidetes bacterium]|nr:LOG family protein [Bacteroidota bacterium]
QFHYFFMRKFWFLYLAKALIVFPGGFGTLDELMELVTLIQTGKMKKEIPIVLFGKDFWNNAINWDYLVKTGTIAAQDLKLFHIYDSVDNAFEFLTENLTDQHFKGPNF